MKNGTIIDQQPIALLPTLYSEGVEAYRIIYSSDGLKVVGFVVKPKVINGNLPLLIFNRGGSEERGLINDRSLSYTPSFFVNHGYVVLATQYRGNDSGEGQDTFGGADVNDVLNLVDVARELGYIDTNKIVMLGVSRGGLMTYLAIRKGLPLKAAAIMSGVTDMHHLYENREDEMREILRRLVGDPLVNSEAYSERSPINWVNEINVPLCIAHGAQDLRVPVEQTREFVAKLSELQKSHIYLEYSDAGHFLRNYIKEFRLKIADFFDSHIG